MHFKSTKTYTHEQGLSCCFRQHRATSHCRYLHGYALQVKLTFRAETLDYRGWVVDFGALKEVKAWLQEMFDHKLLVAYDDPSIIVFKSIDGVGLAQVRIVTATGCEAFAEMIYGYVKEWLASSIEFAHVSLHSVEVSEHDGNSAIYTNP